MKGSLLSSVLPLSSNQFFFYTPYQNTKRFSIIQTTEVTSKLCHYIPTRMVRTTEPCSNIKGMIKTLTIAIYYTTKPLVYLHLFPFLSSLSLCILSLLLWTLIAVVQGECALFIGLVWCDTLNQLHFGLRNKAILLTYVYMLCNWVYTFQNWLLTTTHYY